MITAVESGTARAAGLPGIKVAGKTGSAQNPGGPAHAWFIGFAPAEQPGMAIAVVLENAGSGGALAAPIAGKLLAAAASLGF
ncbi:MAG: Penicillin-binding protein A [Firmicutes bacterium ADurb.Bin456]|nr:MAG: Penicillin-binding protein A [Firmicutes bacterium ADurb.Bin456]